MYELLSQVSYEDLPAGIKLPESFNEFLYHVKNNQYDARMFALLLKAMVRLLLPLPLPISISLGNTVFKTFHVISSNLLFHYKCMMAISIPTVHEIINLFQQSCM